MAKIDIPSIQSNSFRSREEAEASREGERKKLDPVVTNGTVTAKRSVGKRLLSLFVSDEANDVGEFILLDVIVPTIKNTILDVVEMTMFGSSSRRSRDPYRRSYDRGSSYNYSASYRGETVRSRRDRDDRERRDRYLDEEKVDYRNVILSDRRDAERVVDELHMRIREYGGASIADLFNLIDVSTRFTDNNWGWKREDDIGIRRVSRGYLIDVREAVPLD